MAGFLLNGCGASDSYYKIKDLHQARCKCCRRETSWALMELKMKIRIAYIPTVPIRTKYAVICTACKTGFYVDDEQRRFILDHPSSCVEIKEDGVLIHGMEAGPEPEQPRLPVQTQPELLIEEQYTQEQQALQQPQSRTTYGSESLLSGQAPYQLQAQPSQPGIQLTSKSGQLPYASLQPEHGMASQLSQIPLQSDTNLSQLPRSQVQSEAGWMPSPQPQPGPDSERMVQTGQNQLSSGLKPDVPQAYVQLPRAQVTVQNSQCSFCGAAMEESDPFCRNCGRRPAAVSRVQPQEKDSGEQLIARLRVRKICPSCRLTFTGDKEFCGVCGRRLMEK